MTELIPYERKLPEKIDDLAKFVIIGTEKLAALRAEIRAIKRAELAKEVYDQKLEEQQILSGLILDAFVKLGEFTKKLPTKQGKRTDTQRDELNDTDVVKSKTKKEQIAALGLHPKQVERFEAMASHPEIVEQVKAEAKERGEAPTQTEVLRRIKEATNITDFSAARKARYAAEYQQIDEDKAERDRFNALLRDVQEYVLVDDLTAKLDSVARMSTSVNDDVMEIDLTISALSRMKQILIQIGVKMNGEKYISH